MPRPHQKNRVAELAPRQLHTRPPLDRMQQIFAAIKSGGFPNRHRLAAEISDNLARFAPGAGEAQPEVPAIAPAEPAAAPAAQN